MLSIYFVPSSSSSFLSSTSRTRSCHEAQGFNISGGKTGWLSACIRFSSKSIPTQFTYSTCCLSFVSLQYLMLLFVMQKVNDT
mmetsp:Transcript_15779/g.23283  ORF Transcript_15779/g.23283 Transcript_15779/m.23283 type:complete len:83 (-) Transcript_15779:272-520(-)